MSLDICWAGDEPQRHTINVTFSGSTYGSGNGFRCCCHMTQISSLDWVSAIMGLLLLTPDHDAEGTQEPIRRRVAAVGLETRCCQPVQGNGVYTPQYMHVDCGRVCAAGRIRTLSDGLQTLRGWGAHPSTKSAYTNACMCVGCRGLGTVVC